MSTVRYFDDIPHIGRYGMCNEEDGTSWTHFYRNGIRYTIHVDEKDVHGTAFHSIWKPLLGAYLEPGEPILDSYNKFFDLIVSHSLTTLREITPDRPYWITLRDYLHTPAYDLKLVSDNTETDGVRAEISKGPEDVVSYEFRPFPAATFKNMPETIPEYRSDNLIVLDKETDWRVPPHKFRTSDGLICYFKACERSSRLVQTGKVTNRSLDSIEAHLRLFKCSQEKHDAYPARRSTVLGIVTDTPFVPDESDPVTGEESQHDDQKNQALVAGIILSAPTSSHSQTLAKVIAQTETTDDIFFETSRRWRCQIEKEVAHLHSIGIYWGGRDDWNYINQYTVLIDAESGDASLSLDTAALFYDSTSEDICTKLTAMDNNAIEALFEGWLPEELSRKRNEGS
jgi:hypothetical protein